MTYRAPVDDILAVLKTAVGLDSLIAQGIYDGLDVDTVRAILEEAGRFASDVLDPLNRPGDKIGSRLVDGVVATPPRWKEANRQFAQAGRRAFGARLGALEASLSAADDLRRVDRHDEPDRAAGGLGPRRA